MGTTLKVHRLGYVAEEFDLPVRPSSEGLLVCDNREGLCHQHWYRGCILSPGRAVCAGMRFCCEICGPFTVGDSKSD